MISIAQPAIDEQEIDAVVEVMRSGNIAQGEKVFEFERAFSNHFGHAYSVAVSNGTTALHAALLAAGVKPGDRVLTTPFSFIATTNAILYCDAIPCFVDVDSDTFNISPTSLRESLIKWPDAKFLLLVHLFGHPCKMDEIIPLVEEFGIQLIEDCAQAHGATFNGQPVGSFGISGTFSFYPTKNMTTGEGGMITSTNLQYIEDSRQLINHGSKTRYVHDVTGFNYRLTNIAAAIGIVQLSKINQMNQKRKENAGYYLKHIANNAIKLPTVIDNADHVFHQFTIRTKYREKLIHHLTDNLIGYGVYYPIPIHLQKNVIDYYEFRQEAIEAYPVAEEMAQEVLSIPVHPQLTPEQLQIIVAVLNSFTP